MVQGFAEERLIESQMLQSVSYYNGIHLPIHHASWRVGLLRSSELLGVTEAAIDDGKPELTFSARCNAGSDAITLG